MDWGVGLTDNKMLSIPQEQIAGYCAFDLYATAQVYQALRSEMAEHGVSSYYERMVRPRVQMVIRMQAQGLRVDKDAVRRLKKEYREELAETEAVILAADPSGKIAQPTGKSPNGLTSPKRKAEFLFRTLELPVVKLSDTGGESTDQDTLDRLLKRISGVKKYEDRIPILHAMFHRSRLHTILTRYLDLKVDGDGRVRPRIRVYGAETGRLAYSDPAIHQYPSEIRHIFIAAPGHVLVGADAKQIEARVAAYLFRDEPTLEAFRQGKDIHALNARDFFGDLDPEKASKARDASKVLYYGMCLYGGQAETVKAKTFCPCPKCAKKLPDSLSLTREQLRSAQDRWFSIHRGFAEARSALVRTILGPPRRPYRNPFGRLRWFMEPWPSVERSIYNGPIQMTATDIVAAAANRLDAVRPVWLDHHDFLSWEVPTAEGRSALSQLCEEMERPVPEMDGMVYPVEGKMGPNWRDMEKVKW